MKDGLAQTPEMQDLYTILLKSEKFKRWYPGIDAPPQPPSREENSSVNKVMEERHYSVQEIANVWGISVDLARDIFRKEPGVVAFDRTGNGKYITLRVPESVMERVHRKLTIG
jgi:hypothetical protein